MSRHSRTPWALTILVSAMLLPRVAAAQDLGHKLLGTLGLKAGVAPQPGVYARDVFVYYMADRLIDRDGQPIPRAVDLEIIGNVVGVSGVVKVPGIGASYAATIAFPWAHVSARSERPELAIDKLGLGDVYVEPLRLGWRLPHIDLVTGYGFYAPTGEFAPGPRGGLSRGHWTNQFAAGTAIYFDRARAWHLSALASYELNAKKFGIDVTRGDSVQIQGGAGVTLFKLLDLGIIGYGLWQVRDDRGADVPESLRGARDQLYGVGAEGDLALHWIRGQLQVRYAWDVAARSRPKGQILVISLSFKPW